MSSVHRSDSNEDLRIAASELYESTAALADDITPSWPEDMTQAKGSKGGQGSLGSKCCAMSERNSSRGSTRQGVARTTGYWMIRRYGHSVPPRGKGLVTGGDTPSCL